MSKWDDFWKLQSLDIKFSNVSSDGVFIYENGLNTISLTITCKIIDKNNKIIDFSENELRESIYLCEYRNGQSISSPWEVVNTPGDYEGPVSNDYLQHSDEDDTKTTEIKLYLRHRYQSGNDSALVSVGINVPAVGNFDTSEQGTQTLNGPGGSSGSIFKSPKKVSVKTLTPIDYSVPSNLTIEGGWSDHNGMVAIREDLPCSVLRKFADYEELEGAKNKGKMYRGILRIYASKNLKNHNFIKKEVIRNHAEIEDITLHGHNDGFTADIIYGFNTKDEKEEMPVQVFDTSIAFIDAEYYGVRWNTGKGLGLSIYGNNRNNRAYILRLLAQSGVYSNTVSSNFVSVSMLHFRHCAYFYGGEVWTRNGWPNTIQSSVIVYDNFGNTGKITISASSNKGNIGALFINGVVANSEN